VFPHKRIHLATWVSPDHMTEYQIDHICISKKFWRSLLDVRVMRGADVASDHHLVTAKLRLKLKKNGPDQERRRARYNINYLKDPRVLEAYKTTVSNRYQVLQELLDEESPCIEAQWKNIKEALNTACQETLGKKKPKHKDWITPETLKKIQERKEKKAAVNNSRTRSGKAAAQSEYTRVNTEVKNCIKADKRKHIDDLATEAEEAASSRNMKKLYDITKIQKNLENLKDL